MKMGGLRVRVCFVVCLGALAAGGGAGCIKGGGDGPHGDAIMLAENVRLTRSGGSWTAAPPGATANVILGSAELVSHFTETSDGSLVFAGVTSWPSEQGLTPITMASSLQTATANYSGPGHAISGLAGGLGTGGYVAVSWQHRGHRPSARARNGSVDHPRGARRSGHDGHLSRRPM